MRSIEDKGCLNYGPTQEILNSSGISSEFHKANGSNLTPHHRTALGKPAPSKWDDAQKWLVNLSRGGEKKLSTTKPRNSNADDRRLIGPVPKKEDYFSGEEEEGNECHGGSFSMIHYEVETKKVDCDESVWRVNKAAAANSNAVIRSICLRDMGTEMTPIASQEPSRTTTPIRSRTPAAKSPMTSGSSTPIWRQNGVQALETDQTGLAYTKNKGEAGRENSGSTRGFSRDGEESNPNNTTENKNSDQGIKLNPLETRAMAWDEAERAKYMARFKREEVKIEAWENHQKRKAEMEMRRVEVKAERLKNRAQEKFTNKVAATRRIAEEKRANAEAKLNEKAAKTSEKADYIRRTGHLPSSLSFKFPSFCW